MIGKFFGNWIFSSEFKKRLLETVFRSIMCGIDRNRQAFVKVNKSFIKKLSFWRTLFRPKGLSFIFCEGIFIKRQKRKPLFLRNKAKPVCCINIMHIIPTEFTVKKKPNLSLDEFDFELLNKNYKYYCKRNLVATIIQFILLSCNTKK